MAHIIDRLEASGPKRILALDGGGIRGALCIGILEKIEAQLKERYKETHPEFVLADYYDMIGGTSTGAIIATCLAKGMSVAEVKDLYLNMGKTIFSSWKKKLPKWLSFVKSIAEIIEILCSSAHFSVKNLEKALAQHFPTETFGSDTFKTGLCIVTKRADTLSPWVMHNHPKGKYYPMNKGILIKDLLRATSAAPSYFKPKVLTVANNEMGVFIDGGVSSYNNPALILFYICTIGSLHYKWSTGKDNLMITSVGTGISRSQRKADKLANRRIFKWAGDIPDFFMSDATALNQLVLQTMSYTETPQYINSEFNDLKNVTIVKEPMFTYQRYNVSLDKNNLQSKMGKSYDQKEILHLAEMSNGENADILYKIGAAFAADIVKPGHFSSSFDVLYGHIKTSLLDQAQASFITSWLKEKGHLYEKYRTVLARVAASEENIISVISSGRETSNTAHSGEYIVQNQTAAREEYVVKKEKFNNRYEFLRTVDHIWSEYIPKGQVYALQLQGEIIVEKEWPLHFYICASWEELQYCTIGDYLVCPPDGSEFYRIGRTEFEETYKKSKV